MKIPTLNFKKFLSALDIDNPNITNELKKSYETGKLDNANEKIESESIKDQPQVFYANQVIVEQL